MCFSAACVYAFFLFFLERTTLWITRNRQIIAATVMFVHHASSSPREETIFFIVLSEMTPNSVPMMLPGTAGEHRAADDGGSNRVHLGSACMGG